MIVSQDENDFTQHVYNVKINHYIVKEDDFGVLRNALHVKFLFLVNVFYMVIFFIIQHVMNVGEDG